MIKQIDKIYSEI